MAAPDAALKPSTRDYILKCLAPGTVLVSMVNSAPVYAKHFRDGRIVDEIYLDRTGNSPSDEEMAELDSKRVELERLVTGDPYILAAIARLRDGGVSYEVGGQGDACGQFNVLRLRIHRDDLPKLEAVAADAAGFTDAFEREAAAIRFAIFMKRNYSPDYLRWRELLPDVGGSPYSPAGSWQST